MLYCVEWAGELKFRK